MSNPFTFAGGYADSDGLVKFGARYYQPGIGRWTQQDPLGGSLASAETVDKYAYAHAAT